MNRFLTVSGLALRELWISFRLLGLIAVLLAASLPPALLPHVRLPDLLGAPFDALSWYAVALGISIALVAAVAAAALSAERRRGTAGWLVVRAVPRPTIALAWFAGFAVLLVIGLAPALVLGWLALREVLLPAAALPYAASGAAVAAGGLAAVGFGLLLGALLPPLVAGGLTAAATGAALVAAAAGQPAWPLAPTRGLAVLASLDGAATPVADALRGAGMALSLAAVLLVLTIIAFERADL